MFSCGNKIGESRQILQNGVATVGDTVGFDVVGSSVGSSVGLAVVGSNVGEIVGFIVIIIEVGLGVGSEHSHGSFDVDANPWKYAHSSDDNCLDRPNWSAY